MCASGRHNIDIYKLTNPRLRCYISTVTVLNHDIRCAEWEASDMEVVPADKRLRPHLGNTKIPRTSGHWQGEICLHGLVGYSMTIVLEISIQPSWCCHIAGTKNANWMALLAFIKE